MNNAHSEDRGRVIPKWLQPERTFSKGETLIPRKTSFVVNNATKEGIEKELATFRDAPSLDGACYLLGAAALIGNHELSRRSAAFITEHHAADKAIIELADNILCGAHLDFTDFNIDLKVAKVRGWLRQFPRSAIAWIELGRLFTIKGLKDKARRAVLTALSLAPYDRYIVRCGVRFFLHIFDFDAAWHYIRRANSVVRDPWLKATELNVAMLSNKETPFLKGILPSNIEEADLFHYSELNESLGMLELNTGNQKKAKKLFRTAWSSPSESVITHGEWIIRNRLPGLKESAPLDFARSFEALTWVHYYYQDDPSVALETARRWQEEEPYSRSAFAVGACVAGSAGLHDDAVEFAKQGLRANPNDSKLLNSLSYELLRAGRIKDAQEALKRWEQTDNDSMNNVFYLATLGLLRFKMGNTVEGRRLYLDAIEKCKEQGLQHLVGKAYLNLSLTEIEASTPDAMKTTSIALELSENNLHPEIRYLRQELINKRNRINCTAHNNRENN